MMAGFVGFVVPLIMVLLWWWHVRLLKRVLASNERLLSKTQNSQSNLEKKLEQRSHRLDELLSAVHEPIVRVDRVGSVLSANAAAINLFTMRDVSLLPEPMVVFYRNPDWLKAFDRAVKALPEVVELPEIFIAGKVFLPRLAGLGKDQGLLLCLDVTAQYRLQEQRKTFVADLMHDLKTPLTSLLGYARSIEEFSDDTALRQEAVSVIAQEALHVNGLLDALLSVEQIDYSSGEKGRCDVVQVCKQVWQTLQPEMAEKDVTLSVQLPDSFEVGMHGTDCFRVVMNVASNAVHYTAEDSELTCSLEDDILSILDEGKGIPEKDILHVTERFYRVDAVRTRGGHGLGLAIVKETLDRDGGYLQLENRDSKGLRAMIHFPAVA